MRVAGSRTTRAWGREIRGIVGTAWAVVASLAVLGVAPAGAQQEVYSADRVKAAFLYHFTTYVNWPSAALADEVFTIAVLGSESVADELALFLPGHSIQGRPMEVRRVRSVGELDGEEVLYIGARENRRLSQHLASVASRSMLVVTDDPDGLRDGAMINFRIVEERVRFEISLRSAQDAGLELSSRLLSAAMSVEAAGVIPDVDGSVAATDRRASR